MYMRLFSGPKLTPAPPEASPSLPGTPRLHESDNEPINVDPVFRKEGAPDGVPDPGIDSTDTLFFR